jgi:hypothetical protein
LHGPGFFKTHPLPHFVLTNDRFTKTGLGQTQEKLNKQYAFSYSVINYRAVSQLNFVFESTYGKPEPEESRLMGVQWCGNAFFELFCAIL